MAIVWAVNGAKFSADSARAETFKTTGGARGVTLPGDLLVTALPTPGNKVRVRPGGATLPAGYPNAPGQSYGTLLAAYQDVNVPATSSSGGATRYLIQRVTDPQFEGQPPADPVNAVYDSFEWVSSLDNLSYPYVPLAKLVQPANTATITQAMLTDIREVANPREKQTIIARPTLVTDPAPAMNLTYTDNLGEWFPNAGGEQYLSIPEWATWMQIEATWIAVLYGPENSIGWGEYWVDYGPMVLPQKQKYSTHRFRWDQPNGDFSRTNWVMAADVPVPLDLRGQKQVPFIMKARREPGVSAVPKMDKRSGIILKVRFQEVATDVTSS